MSFRKYGGTNKLEKNNNITVHSIVADTFTIRDAFLSIFTIEGDLTIGGNSNISNNLTVNKQINATTLDISTNAIIEGNLYLDKEKDVFLRGNNTMIGINKTTPTATLDISSNRIEAFNLKTSTANNRNIIARNVTDNGIAVFTTGTTESGIQFYSTNTGTIGTSNSQGALIKYSNIDSLLSINSTGEVKVTSKMIITGNILKGNGHTDFDETVLIYDTEKSNQTTFFPEAYGNTTVKTGSALTIQSINAASNTFMNIVDPNKKGIQMGGGSYPKDPTRSMGVIDVYNPAIDVDATPSIVIVSGDDFVKFNSTTGFNTFQPKYNDYAVDINGPLHLNNGEIKKTQTTTNRITKMSNYGTTYGITIGGQGTDSNSGYYAYTTTNGGKTWSRQLALNNIDPLNSIPVSITFRSIYSYDSSRTIVGGESSRSFVTDNGGIEWSQLTTGINTMNAIYIPRGVSQNFIYVGGDVLGGNARIRYGPIVSGPVDPGDGSTVNRYTFSSSNTVNITNAIISGVGGYDQTLAFVGGNIIRTYDIGASKIGLTALYTSTHTSPNISYNAIKFADSLNGVAVGGNVISFTKTGGTSWTSVASPVMTNKTFNDVYLDSSMNAIVVGNNGYIYTSNDNYDTWTIVDEDVLNASGFHDRFVDYCIIDCKQH